LKTLLIVNTTFEDITLGHGTSFIKLTNVPDDGNYSYTISNTTFQNMTFPGPMIRTKNNSLSMSRVLMNNINFQQKLPEKSEEFEDFVEGIEGKCLIAISAQIFIQQSNFTKIQGSCLELKKSELTLESSIFDNSGLAINQTEFENLHQEPEGTWISIEELPNQNSKYSIKIHQSKFLKNTIHPLYGGVI